MNLIPYRSFVPRRLFAATVLVAIGAPAAGPVSAEDKPPAKTKQVDAGDLKLTVPESWKKKEGRQFRVAEFEVPPVGDDKTAGEFVVFHFGKGGAGGVAANVERWINQVDKEGRKVRTVTGESTAGKYTLVDLSGTYNKSIGPPIARQTKPMPKWRVLNVAVETESGPYYLKLDGPEKTIAAVENEFRASFGARKDTEKEQKAE